MRGPKSRIGVLVAAAVLLSVSMPVSARIKLVALPERGKTIVRLDHPEATLIEEERVLTLQKGLNQVDFSWKGVSIDEDSIRLNVITHSDKVTLLSVSYPPNEAALVWEIHSQEAFEVAVRIRYLLSFIDRLFAYKAVADKEETQIQLKELLVLRNFSGEDFEKATVLVAEGQSYEESLSHEETKQILIFKKEAVPIEKRWTFDAAKLPWDPEKLDVNVGIPVSYRVKNEGISGLGRFALPPGKVRVFQEDGHQGTIFLGEDLLEEIPVGEKMEIYIGDSRDIVITQRKMREERINVRRNQKNRIVLYDTDEVIKASIKNFKENSARLTMIQHIPGQWDMEACNMTYERKDANTLEFEIDLPAGSKKELLMHYHRRNNR